MPSQKITNPFLVSVIQGIWKNSGNLIHFCFIIWSFEIAYNNQYNLDQFLYYSTINYKWFIWAMLVFFVFRFWVDNYSRSFLNKIFKK